MRLRNVFVAGHRGMVGRALCRKLESDASVKLVVESRDKLDLRDPHSVINFFMNNAIDEVYLAAAKVGGIHANSIYPGSFIFDNLMIEANVINAAHKLDVQKLLFLGSSCIYPKFAAQPIRESELLNGRLEPTNEPYAIAKIAGIKLCESYNRQYGRDYRSIMPCNLYGPNDNFHPENSHVIPGLIQRFHQAKFDKSKSVVVWGSGTPFREFLYVEDLASAAVFLMNISQEKFQTLPHSHVNVGSGNDCSIADLVDIVAKTVGFSGEINWDTSKPDGTPRKLLDITVLKSLGWNKKTDLMTGIRNTYNWYCSNVKN